MTHGIRLAGFAFAVVETTAEFISRTAPQPVARIPEVSRPRLVGNVAQHPADLSVLDFPECLAAKLEVVALLIDR